MTTNETITITFCECAENHQGMQKIGGIAKNGFTYKELKQIKENFHLNSIETELINFGDQDGENAALLIIRNGVNILMKDKNAANNIYKEHTDLRSYWDKKALMGRGTNRTVKNKNARHNLCFADFEQLADFENGKGTILKFGQPYIKYTSELRETLPIHFGPKAKELLAESNYYYDVKKTYIGFHGDAERKRVIGTRFGSSIPIWFQWFKDSKTVGPMVGKTLNHGDIYIMTERATGYDWMKRSLYTIRHSAGLELTLRNTAGPKKVFESTSNVCLL